MIVGVLAETSFVLRHIEGISSQTKISAITFVLCFGEAWRCVQE